MGVQILSLSGVKTCYHWNKRNIPPVKLTGIIISLNVEKYKYDQHGGSIENLNITKCYICIIKKCIYVNSVI